MQSYRSPYTIAFRAIVLGLCLPIVAFMFLAIRTRQLQSTANPRWAQFAKLTGPQAAQTTEIAESNRLAVRTASIRSAQYSTTEADRLSLPEPNLSGSVAGRGSIITPNRSERDKSEHEEYVDSISRRTANKGNRKLNYDSSDPEDADEDAGSPTRDSDDSIQASRITHPRVIEESPKNAIPRATMSDYRPLVVRPVDDDRDSRVEMSTLRLESQLTEVRQRLDQLALQQQQHRAEDAERGLQVLSAVKSFHDLVSDALTAPETPDEPVVVEPSAEVPSRTVPVTASPAEESATKSHIVTEPPSEKARVEELNSKIPTAAQIEIPPTVAPPLAVTVSESSTSSPKTVPDIASSNSIPSPTETSPPASVQAASPKESVCIRRETAKDGSDLFTMDVRDVDIRQLLCKFSEVAKVGILSSPDVTGQISLTINQARFDAALKAMLESHRFVFGREGDVVVICSIDEAARLKNENHKLVMKIYQLNYLSTSERNRLINGVAPDTASNPISGDEDHRLESSGQERSIYARDRQSPISRHNLGRTLYERAIRQYDLGEYVKARQLVEASLRQNRDDLDAIRLRNEIDQWQTQNASR